MPWALSLALRCYDMVSGTLHNLPFSGGAWEQDDLLMSNIETARRAWLIFGYKPANKIKWTPDDADFMAWVDNGTD